jgi:hypothetical protein
MALPNLQQANDALVGMQMDVFYNTLASRGYPAQSEKQAQAYLEMSDMLEAAPQTKQAEADDPILAARNDLAAYLGQSQQKQAEAFDLGCQRLAAHYLQVPGVFDSALAIKAAQAQELQTQLASQQS